MGNTSYASAVAAVRAMENSLLTHSDIEQLIASKSKAEYNSLISAKGSEQATLEDVWDMLRAYAPNDRELEILLYKNDFHNLKAALKAVISGKEPQHYFILPTNLDLDKLVVAIKSKEYEYLPEYIRKTAQEAYELLTRTLDGQLSDSVIDTAALEAMQRAAYRHGGEFMRRYAEMTALYADIKTAYRCALMKKSKSFIETAVCGTSELDKDSLVRAALEGVDGLFAYLENTQYSDAAKLLRESPAKFEKLCDDEMIELAQTSRMTAFGTEPLAAYYLAKEAEIKNLRIISVCKESGTDRETITERMRKLYV
jgi:V/A-type H+-transporting ATPase subunit C